MGSQRLTGAEFQFSKPRRVLEKGGGDGNTAMRMDSTPLNRTLKDCEEGKFYVYFTTI